MLKIIRTHPFEEGYEICKLHYGKDNMRYLFHIIDILTKNHKLPKKYKDHPIDKGKYRNKNYRDCHVVEVDNDWVLIYKKTKFELILINTGSHQRLFKSK